MDRVFRHVFAKEGPAERRRVLVPGVPTRRGGLAVVRRRQPPFITRRGKHQSNVSGVTITVTTECTVSNLRSFVRYNPRILGTGGVTLPVPKVLKCRHTSRSAATEKPNNYTQRALSKGCHAPHR